MGNRYSVRPHFNSRPSARGDADVLNIAVPTSDFNSRPSARGDEYSTTIVCCTANFNSRPSARGDADVLNIAVPTSDFNSRPSARGDVGKVLSGVQSVISIHAPPRGATPTLADFNTGSIFQFTPLREGRLENRFLDKPVLQFQFTPLREGRPPSTSIEYKKAGFQFTPLREGRPVIRRKLQQVRKISIHAPPRGATVFRKPFICSGYYFNSRPSARGDEV